MSFHNPVFRVNSRAVTALVNVREAYSLNGAFRFNIGI